MRCPHCNRVISNSIILTNHIKERMPEADKNTIYPIRVTLLTKVKADPNKITYAKLNEAIELFDELFPKENQ